jgi:hypothetical protein
MNKRDSIWVSFVLLQGYGEKCRMESKRKKNFHTNEEGDFHEL